nr:MAG TPA: hypothetical protein [Herelleviridae sp.]
MPLPSKSPHGFNTQPPEGGWAKRLILINLRFCFNTQPPEGGWLREGGNVLAQSLFQHTAARRRLVRPTRADVD